MDRYLKRKEREELDINNLPSDPGLRPSIWSYDVNDRDRVRRAYLAKGPHQPKTHNFPQTNFGNTSRRFNPKWFEEYPHWLEYSIQKDSAYCLYCYLFKAHEQTSTAQGGGDSFVIEGFKNWKKKEKFLASCKRSDTLKAIQHEKVLLHIKNGDLISGRGLNQEQTLQRAGDTRWSSHFHTLISLKQMYASVIEVLEIIKDDGVHDHQSVEAGVLIVAMESFEFIFTLHLMIDILGVTNELSQSLQRKDQDIVNAMKLVQISKQRLQMMRESGWDDLIIEVSRFCAVFEVDVPDMSSTFKPRRRAIRRGEEITNLHHYRVEFFYTVIDMQLQELNNRFSEASTELLLCVACLSPVDSFSAFDQVKLVRLAQLYPTDFSTVELTTLNYQLGTYIIDMRTSADFLSLSCISDLAKEMVKTKKNGAYPLVYRLIILALTLPVATATVERAFSAMKIVKNRLRGQMGDDWLNDCLVPYIEKDVFELVPNEVIMQYYQSMQNRLKSL